jgi:hypothetical protein
MEQVIDLATRKSGGIAVALIWDRRAQELRVIAYDRLTDEEIVVPVSGEEAAEVYRHPFAYSNRAIPPASGEQPARRRDPRRSRAES